MKSRKNLNIKYIKGGKMKKVKIIALIMALLLVSALIISCSCSENYQELEALTCEFIDTLIADDKANARALLDDIITDESFEKSYPDLVNYVKGVGEYELKQTAWQKKKIVKIQKHQQIHLTTEKSLKESQEILSNYP